ncbi:M15 family metallopeptidase [Nitriliruptor alkaliphilus]|uniref:M15 family metallopeptidase n=1 Tax=Nitriliruptor alkaliphilus TaxID=427918 RepID=UPI000B0D0E1B|nr:M15 family metallopeptidase [Nitriliruptor alkaliphilus]
MPRRHVSLIAVALVASTSAVGSSQPAAAAADLCAGAPRAPYVDVPDAHTHADAIDCLHGLAVIRGRLVDAFEPATSLRRDQMATIIAGSIEAAGGRLPAPDRGAFPDVSSGPHRDAIERLAAAGIVEGRADGSYAPGAHVPRGQMTAFLVRAHDHVLGPSDEPAPSAFEDTAGHPHEATIDRAAQLGLASGKTATRFAPQELTLRGQTATFVARLLHRSADAGVMTAPRWGFTSSVHRISASLERQITGSSWHAGRDCPPFTDLRLLEIVHRGFDGRDRVGLLVLHRDAVADVRVALTRSYEAGFHIERMRLVDRYGADDDRSMAANNSSAFNCRTVSGSTRWSEHAYGRAIDINPVQNPYVAGSTVEPEAGRAYLDRSNVRRGMLVRGDATVTAFKDRGWGWGGDWSSIKDYMHLSSTGR